jgi:hypothetical protein
MARTASKLAECLVIVMVVAVVLTVGLPRKVSSHASSTPPASRADR